MGRTDGHIPGRHDRQGEAARLSPVGRAGRGGRRRHERRCAGSGSAKRSSDGVRARPSRSRASERVAIRSPAADRRASTSVGGAVPHLERIDPGQVGQGSSSSSIRSAAAGSGCQPRASTAGAVGAAATINSSSAAPAGWVPVLARADSAAPRPSAPSSMATSLRSAIASPVEQPQTLERPSDRDDRGPRPHRNWRLRQDQHERGRRSHDPPMDQELILSRAARDPGWRRDPVGELARRSARRGQRPRGG